MNSRVYGFLQSLISHIQYEVSFNRLTPSSIVHRLLQSFTASFNRFHHLDRGLIDSIISSFNRLHPPYRLADSIMNGAKMKGATRKADNKEIGMLFGMDHFNGVRWLVSFQYLCCHRYLCNSSAPPEASSNYYDQSGPLMPYLCYPYDSQLQDLECPLQELSMANAFVCDDWLLSTYTFVMDKRAYGSECVRELCFSACNMYKRALLGCCSMILLEMLIWYTLAQWDLAHKTLHWLQALEMSNTFNEKTIT
ncbi:hypothetical protein L6452_06193 [Arctium lappa]|uniref:Uncharacterized protein n=1 Tax=Arctium lappa TaxID=4217 RepID=A0ACB9EIT8_ARCLA|nr:hypothetical protein L6452_06193 [Arctium lappa]